jgi:hypothetical protein
MSVPITITLHADREKELALDTIEIAALDYATSLIEDLALPTGVTVTVARSSDEALQGRCSIAIGTNAPRVERCGEEGAVAAIVGAIYADRSFFVTTEAARSFASTIWGSVVLGDFVMIYQLRELMASCVDRNVSLERLRRTLRPLRISAVLDRWELLLRVHEEKAVAVSIAFPPEDVRGAFPAEIVQPGESWAMLQVKVFEGLGLLCPVPRIESGPELGPDEWQIRINDVRLPPLSRRPEMNAEQFRAAAERHIARTPQAFVTRDGIRRRVELLRQTAPALVEELTSGGDVAMNTLVDLIDGVARKAMQVNNLPLILDGMLVVAPMSRQ